MLSLYRNLLRETNKLPHTYLRLFFKLKLRDDFKSDYVRGKAISFRASKLKRLNQELRKLQAANSGNKKALTHVLDVAYGRKGKLKWELLEPFLKDPSKKADPIIPGVESSRPPVYGPELTALLTSNISRPANAIKPANLVRPPILPERADPKSEIARLIGPLSLRRRKNLLLRYHKFAVGKLIPPLEMALDRQGMDGKHAFTRESRSVVGMGVQCGGMQDTRVLDEVYQLVGAPRPSTPNLTRRQRKALPVDDSAPEKPLQGHPLPRWLRRRHQELLYRIPLLTHHHETYANRKGEPQTKRYWSVSLARQSIGANTKASTARLKVVSPDYMTWIRRADELDSIQKEKGRLGSS